MYRTPKDHCPVCHHVLDACSDFENNPRGPQPGDVSLCIECATVLVFNDNLTRREATSAEIGDWDHEVRMSINRYRQIILKLGK